jgi:hypothetical protein
MSFIINPYVYAVAGCTDADANAFLTATGITNPTISSAICTLVTSMKANGTWAKCLAIYPFVGGTATTHMYNLKNPANTNAAFRLSFIGGITHSLNGITGNAVNGYCNTFIPNTAVGINSNHIATYSRSSFNENSVDIGTYGQNPPDTWGIHHSARGFGIGMFFRNQNGTFANAANADGRGLYISTRTASNFAAMYKNGTQTCSLAVSPVAMQNENFQILAINNAFHSSRNLAFASIGDGLTNTDASNLYSTIQTFQTTLGRQV